MHARSWKRTSLGLARRFVWRVRPPVLALGGGGARGFAHIGALRSIDRAGLPVRAIAGTSMGAIVGAMYATLGGADAVFDRWREALDRKLIPDVQEPRATRHRLKGENALFQAARRFRDRVVVSFALHRTTMLDDAPLIEAIDFLLPEGRVEELQPRFIAAATDIETGEVVLLSRGSLRTAVRASSSIPAVLPAVEIDQRRLVDGGVVAEVPVAAARALGGPVIAFDVSMDLPPLADEDIALDTLTRTQMMTARRLRQRQLKEARWVIRLPVGHATWSAWDLFEDLVSAGDEAMSSWLAGAPAKAGVR